MAAPAVERVHIHACKRAQKHSLWVLLRRTHAPSVQLAAAPALQCPPEPRRTPRHPLYTHVASLARNSPVLPLRLDPPDPGV